MRKKVSAKKRATNNRVGKKIAHLEKEGVKPKQAVAEALNMERKGRLTSSGGYKRVHKKGGRRGKK